MVKEDGANVVQVAVEGEQAAALFPVPNLYLVVVSTRDKERLGRMKMNASHRTYVSELDVLLRRKFDVCGEVAHDSRRVCSPQPKRALRNNGSHGGIPSCSSNLSMSVPSW